MRSRIDVFVIFLFIHLSGSLFAQNTSNRGTDFWLGYMAHYDSTASSMTLFITSDINTSGTVSVPLKGWSTPFTVTANIVTIITVPTAIAYDSCSDCTQNKGINITSVLPIVVYAEIFYPERSEATLVLPVPALGNEYYAMTFTQTNSGGMTGYSAFLVVAAQDSTQVQITPTQKTLGGHAANVPFTVTLNHGQVYQVESANDLTGSHISTYSSTTASCKPVALFSGSTWDALGCSSAGSGDNLLEQCYPVNAWGNNFVTAPFRTRTGGDEFRVLAASNNTVVILNGVAPFILNAGQYLDTVLATANYITASNPITLAQYSRSQGCDNITGDPSMVILLPVEQTLDTITVYSAADPDFSGDYINVITKTANVNSFRLDGLPVSFSVVPSNPLYSYSQNPVDSGDHILTSDSGFNAIAYGFGDVDAYSYCAGANVRNLNQYITVNSNGIGNLHTVCNGATVNFSGVVSYTPASVEWYFGDGETSLSLSTTHVYNTPGTYTISLVTVNGAGSCGTKDSSTYILTITPAGTGTVSANPDSVCGGSTSQLTVSGNTGTIQWQSSSNGISFTNIAGATSSIYQASDITQTTYYRIITTNNCGVDSSLVTTVNINPSPVAGSISSLKDTICAGTVAHLSVNGNTGSEQWQSSADSIAGFSNITGSTNKTYSALLSKTTYYRIVGSNGICPDTSVVFTQNVAPSPLAAFSDSITGQTVAFNSSASSGGDYYYWDFGDSTSSMDANPMHTYNMPGAFHVCLTIRNNTNCTFTSCQNITVFPNGINNLNVEDEFQVYPNPFGNSIFIDGKELNNGISSVAVYDLLGRVVFIQGYNAQKIIEVPLFNLSASMYYLEVKSGNANYFRPIIKQ